jgi:DNA-binding NtrC family response regulator
VLVVEDQHVVRRGLTRVLERAGFSVVAAEGLLEAREALDTHAVDLLVTVLRLLDGTGFQVTDEARQLTPGLPVLWISGHPPAATERPADVQFLEKPFTAVQILDAVRQTLGISAPAS